MSDLVSRPEEYLIEYDASSTGIGLRIFSLDKKGAEKLTFVMGFDTDFDLKGNSKYQNTMEFTAVVMGMTLLASEGISHAGVRLRGDSTTSLVWATEESFKAGPSENAAAAFLVIGKASQNFVECGDHLAGVKNTKCDKLSRGKIPEELGYNTRLIRHLEDIPAMVSILRLCNPTVRHITEEDIGTHWRELLVVANGCEQFYSFVIVLASCCVGRRTLDSRQCIQ